MVRKTWLAVVAAASLAWLGGAHAQLAASPNAAVQAAATAQKQPLLDTLKTLVNIETGSRDHEGITQATALVGERLKALGAKTVEFVEADPATTYKMSDTPDKIGRAVVGTFTGTGTKRILLIAHIDTVYLKGMLAKQPFRIEGNKAYGLGIADDKQGVATILHAIQVLNTVNFKGYGTLTVIINGDEEISSPGSRDLLTRAGAAHDATLSFEATRHNEDRLSLATSGIAAVVLTVEGRASHAGGAPERGINALYELSHQVLQMRDMSVPERGLKLNWTVSQSGSNRNVIPAYAQATADVRVLKVEDYDGIETAVRERAKKQLLPDAKVTVEFERRRPPLEVTAANRKMAAHAQLVYAELGRKLVVGEVAEGGGTDAAFAALKAKGPVVERFGLPGFGAHSADSEWVDTDAIVPRLYLAARMVMDLSAGKGL